MKPGDRVKIYNPGAALLRERDFEGIATLIRPADPPAGDVMDHGPVHGKTQVWVVVFDHKDGEHERHVNLSPRTLVSSAPAEDPEDMPDTLVPGAPEREPDPESGPGS